MLTFNTPTLPMSADVVMYRTRFCPYCVRAEFLLKKKGIAFRTVDVSGDRQQRDWLIQTTGLRTVPQIFINGQPIGGCDELYGLERSGRLDALLASAPPPA